MTCWLPIRPPQSRFSRIYAIVIVATICIALSGEELTIGYTFTRDGQGGMATVAVDSDTGQILGQDVKFESHRCVAPKKIRRVDDGRTFVITHDDEKMPYIFIVDVNDSKRNRLIELPGAADEVRIAGTQALITCTNDYIATVDIQSRRILGVWDVSDHLKPPANHPQGILVTPNQKFAIFAFQKDSKTGNKLGGRLAVFGLPGMDVVADVVLARDYAGWKLDNEIRQDGPGLELVFLDEENDTIVATADHYGAVAIMRWSELVTGQLKILEYRSTAFDDSWGESFPDRGTLFRSNEASYCLVCNSGVDGGSVIVDLQSWQTINRMGTIYGLETPVFIPQLSKAFSTCPGKRKKRERGEVVKEYVPQPFLTIFDIHPSDVSKSCFRKVRHDAMLFHLGVLDREDKTPLFVMSSGKEQPDHLLVYDPATEKFLDKQPAVGLAVQFASD